MNVIDMHCDTFARLYNDRQKALAKGSPVIPDFGNDDSYCINISKMQKGNYLLQNFAVFIDRQETATPAETAFSIIDLYEQELKKYSDFIAPVFQYEDIVKNQSLKKISAMLTLEEGAVLQGNLNLLYKFYQKGVRMITLTWNYPNEIGFPNLTFDQMGNPLFTNRNSNGLTDFGIRLIQEMEALGIIIDVSHLSDGGFYDILKYTEKPFVASHSNSASMCNICRNLTDDMIRKLGERGGIMGLNYCADFLCQNDTPTALSTDTNVVARLSTDTDISLVTSRIDDMIRHIKYITNLGGIEICGLGSDFDGIDNSVEFKDASGVELLYDALIKHGFSSDDADKIFYKNVLRLYKDTLKGSESRS